MDGGKLYRAYGRGVCNPHHSSIRSRLFALLFFCFVYLNLFFPFGATKVSTRDTAFSGAATPHWLPFIPADANTGGGGGASGFGGGGTSAALDGDIGAGELLFAVELVALQAPETSNISSSGEDAHALTAAALAAVVACPAPPASLTAVPSTRRWLDIMVRAW